MAEPIVAAIAQWIGSLLIREANTLFKVVDQVKGLQRELELMQEYLRDADTKQDERIRTLVRQITKLAYEAEDVIDTYILKIPTKDDKSRLVRYGLLLYNAPDIYRVGKRIKDIQSDVHRMAEILNGYGVRRTAPEFRKHAQPSYSFEDNNNEYIVGLTSDISKLLQVIMGEGNTHINILAIVGMGGSGKTTLARKLYNHPYCRECYNCMAWVYISQEWNTQHILSEILRNVSGDHSNRETYGLHATMSREELVDRLRNTLKGKSYLIVLDDVWRREALEEILPALPFEDMNRGSKIIITTRKRDIIHLKKLQHNRLFVHEPQPLGEEEGWQLFSKLALSHCKNNLDNFEGLGKFMLKNCGGLPLAIVALAGYLKTRASIGEWQRVSYVVKSKITTDMHSNTHDSVQDLLALSYDDLSYDLKLCFLYLGVFPEDYQIPAGMLTRMWIAEGLITAHEGMSLEDVANEHLEELSHRFMIQVVRTNFMGAIKAFQLHDLMRDICLKKAKEQSFLQIYGADSNQATDHASILPRRLALHSSMALPTNSPNLRSLIFLKTPSIQHSVYDSMEMLDLKVIHQNLKLLRLLNLWGIQIENGTLPETIGSLIHLRYLILRATNITELPSSIGNLRNLMTLDYRDINSDKGILLNIKIPNVLYKLSLLRHLFLPIEYMYAAGELHLSDLKNLQILWGLRFCERDNTSEREMKKLSTSVKKLRVYASTEKDLQATFDCPSLKYDWLHTLHCEWKVGVTLRDINTISHNQLLHKLVLVGKIEVNDLSLILPHNLVILELRDCILKEEDPMMVAGKLPHLKFLKLSNSYLGDTFTCDFTTFPVLEELYLESLPNLITWNLQQGAMSCLKKVMVTNCMKLEIVPKGLPFVANLKQERERSKLTLRLPDNFEYIIEHSDSIIDTTSINNFYEQLFDGVFLNGRRQKFWIKMHNNSINCFKLYAKHLSQVTDNPFGVLLTNNLEGVRVWTKSIYSEVSPIVTVGNWFQLKAQIKMEFLSPNVIYEIAFVIMIPKSIHGYIKPASYKCYLVSSKYKEEGLPDLIGRGDYELRNKPREKWIPLVVGEIRTPHSHGQLIIVEMEIQTDGVLIESVLIQHRQQWPSSETT